MRISFSRSKTTIEDLSPIALANLVAAVCSETEADNKIAAYNREALVEHFQQIPAYGDADSPTNLNDGNTVTTITFTLNEYAIIEPLEIVKITQFRFYPWDLVSSDDAEIKIEYRDPSDGSWIDWVTNKVIPMTTSEWKAWDNSGGEVVCDAIRVTCTKVDSTTGNLKVYELEVKY